MQIQHLTNAVMTLVSKPDAMPWRYLPLTAVIYFAGAKLGMVTVMPEGMAVLWLPNSIVLAALIRFRGSRAAAIAPTVVITEVVADVPAFTVVEAVLFGLINFSESALAYALLRRWRFDPGFASLADLWKFVLAGPLVAAFGAALLGAAVYSIFRGGATSYFEFARIWWFGDGLGLLILTPMFLGFRPFRVGSVPPGPALEAKDAAFFAGAAAALALLWVPPDRTVLGVHFGPVVLLPFAVYAASRYPKRWVSVLVVAFSTVLVLAMTQGRMPFGALAPRDAVVQAQEFMFTLSVLALGFAALLAQLRRQQDELEVTVAERTRELHAANETLAMLAFDESAAREALARANVALEQRQVEVVQASLTDPLTGVGNRRRLDQALAVEISRAGRGEGPLSALMVDLDHFKRVNDEFGHPVGDRVLAQLGALLRSEARPTDTVARYGGEEFVVLMPHARLSHAIAKAERLRVMLEQLPIDGIPRAVTASFGVAELEDREDGVAFVGRLDAAMYAAKSAGRNTVIAAEHQVRSQISGSEAT